MRNTILGIAMLMAISASAQADDKPAKHQFRAGFGMDLGVPSGVALGFVVHPASDWLTLQASVTYNAMAPGGRLSLQLDPFGLLPNCPIGLFVDVQGGFAAQGSLVFMPNSPSVGYDYVNFYGGLRFGKPNGFHWNIEVGPTYMHVNTDNFQSWANSQFAQAFTVGNPTAQGWVLPTFMTGFEVMWP